MVRRLHAGSPNKWTSNIPANLQSILSTCIANLGSVWTKQTFGKIHPAEYIGDPSGQANKIPLGHCSCPTVMMVYRVRRKTMTTTTIAHMAERGRESNQYLALPSYMFICLLYRFICC